MQNISLQCLSGPLSGQIFRLTGKPIFIFGRYAKSHFSLTQDPAASHLHFIIDVSGDTPKIFDLGSTNGLIINDNHVGGKLGKPMTEYLPLKPGDIIMAGSSMFRLNIDSQTDSKAEDHKKSQVLANFRRATTRPAGGAVTKIAPRFNEDPPTQRVERSGKAQIPQESDDVGTDTESDNLPEIDGYSLVGRVGGGGKGVVFKAIKNDTGAIAAIKMLSFSKSKRPRSIEVFRREILITKQINHPNIVRYLGDGSAGGSPYLALEFVDGGNLDEFIATQPSKRLDLHLALPLFIQVLEAVAYMHSHSLVHRDVKPKNILLDPRRGGTMSPKLSDMGLACRFTALDSADLLPIITDGGTPAYMPPEQLLDVTRALPQSDVFSAAATFYHMVTGTLLYEFRDTDQAEAIIEGNIKPILYLRPDLPLGVANVISKALSYNPENRYSNAQEMLDVLRQALA